MIKAFAMLASTSIVSLTLAVPAFAQDQDSAPAATDTADHAGEIIVTAQKRAENVQDVPVSITAFSRDSMVKANMDQVQDIGRMAPNFSMAKIVAATGVRLSVRGVGAVGNTATEPSVAAFLDGAYIPRAGSTLAAFLDIDGVEVLRGPQGTLFGRNASVGALSLHSAKPTDEFSAHVTGEVGNFDRYRLEGHVNLPLAENIAFRAAGAGNWFGGYWHNAYDGKTYGQQDDFSFRGSLKAQFGPVEWLVRADYTKLTGDGVTNTDFDRSSVSPTQLAALQARIGGVLPDTNLNDRVMNHYVEGSDLNDRQWGLSSEVSLDLGDGTLRLLNSYRDWKDHQIDGDVIFLPLPILGRTSKFASKSQNHELQYISPVEQWLDGRLDLVAGLYYFEEDYSLGEQFHLNSQFCNTLVPAGASRTACADYLTINNGRKATDQTMWQNTKSYAAYGQLNFKLFEPLTLVLGGRWTHESKKGQYSQLVDTPFALSLRAPEVLTLPDLDESRFSYRIGLNFKPVDSVMIFASYSTGYKSGGYNSGGGTPSLTTFDTNGDVVSTKRVFGRETVKNYEAGIKSTWLDRALTANLTFYRMDIDGYQDRSFDGISFIIRNAGSLRQQGFEFDTVLRPSRNFSVTGSLAYLDSAFTNFPAGSGLPGLPAGTTQNLKGAPATYSPEWTGQVGFDWMGALGGSGLTWNLNANVSFVSDQSIGTVTDNNPQTIQDGYALLGARFTINGANDRWSVAIFGKNLTNTQYASGAFYQVLGAGLGLNNGVFNGSAAVRQVHAEPRTYGASVTFRF